MKKQRHYAKYGAPNTYYKKMKSQDQISKTLIKDTYKIKTKSFEEK